MQVLRGLGAALLAATLGACAGGAGGGGTTVKSQVLTPAPASPSESYFVEKADVQSRDTGDDAWRRNQEYGRLLTDALRDALRAAGKTIAPEPAPVVRQRIYLAWEDPQMKQGKAQGDKARIEIRLQVIDAETRAVRYSTLTTAPIKPEAIVGYQYGDDRDQKVRKAIDKAVEDFVSRL